MPDPLLKVLLLTGRLEVRGSSRQTLTLARHLAAHQVETMIVCTDAGVLPKTERRSLQVREYGSLVSPLAGRIAEWLLASELRNDPPDLIHVQQRSMLPIGRRLAHRLQRPYIASIHDYLGPRETLRFAWRWCRMLTAVSQSVKDELVKVAGIPEDRIVVIHSGVDTKQALEVGEILDPHRAPVIGTAGPLEAAKGLRYFVDAIPPVLAQHPRAEFLIAGAGPEEHNLRRQVRDLGVVEHVTFVPNVLELGSSLAAMDAFVLPSLRQGLGTIMLEAMLRGRPVIATNAGGVYSVVEHGRTGLLVPPRNSSQLAASINELLDNPVRARAMGHAARQMVCEQFPVDRMVEHTANLYREVLGAVPIAST
ncbi:MAG: glycosyltransferase family 4 protein [Planctomycetaceae bacterium]|nr:glycosyltransferase family 4 protein [Planctomycetaceae bacterium]